MADDKRNHTLFVLVLILAAAVVGLLVKGHRANSVFREKLADVTEQLEETTAVMKTMAPKESVVALEENVVDLKEKLAVAEDVNEQLEAQLVTAIDASTGPQMDMNREEMQEFEDMMAGKLGGDDGNGDNGQNKGKGFGKAMSNMFKGEQGRKMAEHSAKMAIDMQYAGFFEELNLDADTEQQVRDIMQAVMVEQMTKGFESLDKGIDVEAMEATEDIATGLMRERLSEVLNGSQMAMWEEYESTKEARILTKTYDMQLSMFASGLSEENRLLAADIMVEEVLAMQESRKNNPDIKRDMRGEMDAQLQAFEMARERLATQLDDRQLAQFDRFIDQQKSQVEMAINMTGGMFGNEETAEEPVPAE